MDKPLTVAREEFVEKIVTLVNESRMPAFIMEAVLKDITAEVHAAAQQQYEHDKKAYEESLKPEGKETAAGAGV